MLTCVVVLQYIVTLTSGEIYKTCCWIGFIHISYPGELKRFGGSKRYVALLGLAFRAFVQEKRIVCPRGTSHGYDAAGWKSVVANNCPWRSLRLQSAPRPHQECQSVVAFQFLVALGDAMPRANKQTASALVVAAKVSAESCRPTSSSTSEEEKG